MTEGKKRAREIIDRLFGGPSGADEQTGAPTTKLGWMEFWSKAWGAVGPRGKQGRERVEEALGGRSAREVKESGQSLEQILATVQNYAKEKGWFKTRGSWSE